MKRDPRACPYCGSPARRNPCFWAVDRSPSVIASGADAPCDLYDDDFEAVRFPRGRLIRWIIAVVIVLSIFGALKVRAMDDGRYAGSPLKGWFDGLSSANGLCCSVADGRVLSSVEWDNLGPNGSYRVRIGKDDWIVVPDEALLTVPNKAGEAWVWTYPGEPKRIRCFIAGAGT